MAPRRWAGMLTRLLIRKNHNTSGLYFADVHGCTELNNLYFFLEGVGISLPPTDTRTKPRTTRAYLQKSRTEQPKRR